MQPAEVRDGGALLGTALGEFAELARDVHKAIAARVFGLLGPVGAPVRMLHDAISATAYAGARLGARTVPAAAGAIAAETGTPSTEAYGDTPRGHFTLSALNGFWGDRLAEDRAALAPVLSLRTSNGRLRRMPGNVAHDAAADTPTATGKLVVFLHGLCESDRYWGYGAQRCWGDPRTTYGTLLQRDRSWTPLYGHYNTGLHISENGRLLAGYLQTLVDEWPVPVTEIALIGHSMGGLVARSAAHRADDHRLAWRAALRHIVGLGAPHLGAPLERWVNAGTHAMARLPETKPLATWLNQRSVGIKDLRYGSIVEADWFGIDPDERLMDRCSPATLLDGVAYSMVSATLSERSEGRFAHDLLVEHLSAHGTGRPNAVRRIEFEVDRLAHVGRRTHFHLLNDQVVYDRIRSWLDGADGAAGPLAEGIG
jgi:pimeloyl-ACP methyl ester carboxylesterase